MIRAGVISDYFYEKTPSGREVFLPIEETPDDLFLSHVSDLSSLSNLETNLPLIRAADYIVTTIPLTSKRRHWTQHSRVIGFVMIAFSLGGIFAPMSQQFRLEAGYHITKTQEALVKLIDPPRELPASVPKLFEPLIDNNGEIITPVDTEFSIIVPSVGINAPVIANVNPGKVADYTKALETGVAHAKTSYLPNEDGTVYLFSHSTNYDWFVKDLNAVFYLLKNIKKGDHIVLYYQGKRYTYLLTETKVVKPKDISYLVPVVGKRSLILQTCWPPGSVTERLLLFADLVNEDGKQI